MALTASHESQNRIMGPVCGTLTGVGLLALGYGLLGSPSPQVETYWTFGGGCLTALGAFLLLASMPWAVLAVVFVAGGITCLAGGLTGLATLVAVGGIAAGITAFVSVTKFVDQLGR